MSTMFKTIGGLSEIDRSFLSEKTAQSEPPKAGKGQIVHRGQAIQFKKIEKKTGREWKCPFCTCSNSTTLRKCNSCGAHDGSFGNLCFAYKTPNKALLDSSGYDSLKEAARREFGT